MKRIETVVINKYKAFKSEEIININEQNVFIYGENGSGKSSFYYALKDFFQSSVEDIDLSKLRNYNLDDGLVDCSIKITLSDGIDYKINEESKNTDVPFIKDANRLKSFVNYKHLLGVHNVKINKKINVFELIVNGVLKHYKSALTNGVELIELHNQLIVLSKKPFGRGTDYYFAKQKKAAVDLKMKEFNAVLTELFLFDPEGGKPSYLGPDVNYFLNQFFPDLKIEFKRQAYRTTYYGELLGGGIYIDFLDREIDISEYNPHFSLNEAKLSAIAISIFLGAIKSQRNFSNEIKPLFLDDILIGLDNENRLKLIDILQEPEIDNDDKIFKDFQIFITTYDRHWYEVAKIKLNKQWKFMEFYKGVNGPVIIQNIDTGISLARKYYDAYDFPACANNLRKECERILKEKLLNPYTVGEGIKGAVKPLKLDTLIKNFKTYFTDCNLEPPIELVNDLIELKMILFNPMSHDDIESPIYKDDLDRAFAVLNTLDIIELPTRELILRKATKFSLSLPEIKYEAELELANNFYKITNAGINTFTEIKFHFNTWKREGVEFAKPTGTPVLAIENIEKLSLNFYNLSVIVRELNKTYSFYEEPEIEIEFLKNQIKNNNCLMLNDYFKL